MFAAALTDFVAIINVSIMQVYDILTAYFACLYNTVFHLWFFLLSLRCLPLYLQT